MFGYLEDILLIQALSIEVFPTFEISVPPIRPAEHSLLGTDQTHRCSFRATSPHRGIPIHLLVCSLAHIVPDDLPLL